MAKVKKFRPTLRFSASVRTDRALGGRTVVIGGQVVDLSKIGTQVRVSGPRDAQICARCIRFVGNTYNRTDPSIQAFRYGGLHKRCRHYLVPVGVPGFDREISQPGDEFVESLVKHGDQKSLGRLYGRTRTDALVSGKAKVSDLYDRKGKLRTVKNLTTLLKRKGK